MPRKFIALIVAASLAVTGLTAAPAQASEKDVARALAAIAGIAIIGAAINDRNKSKRRHAPYVSSRGNNHHGYYQPRYQRQHKKAHRQHRKAHRRHHRSERRAYRQGYRQGHRHDQRRYQARPRYAH